MTVIDVLETLYSISSHSFNKKDLEIVVGSYCVSAHFIEKTLVQIKVAKFEEDIQKARWVDIKNVDYKWFFED